MIALGIDPGLASFGVALVSVEADGIELKNAEVIRTEKSPKKRTVLQADDLVRRLREIANVLEDWFPPVDVVCAESMSWPRNASAAAKMASTWGLIVAIADGRPLIQASPQRIKRVLTGSASASKGAVAEAVRTRFHNVDDILAHVPASKREHAYDAAAAVLASLDSDVIRALRRVA